MVINDNTCHEVSFMNICKCLDSDLMMCSSLLVNSLYIAMTYSVVYKDLLMFKFWITSDFFYYHYYY